MKYTNVTKNWNLTSTEDGIRIVNDLAWSDRPTPDDELAAVSNMVIYDAFYDTGLGCMLFLLSGKETGKGEESCYRLMKVDTNENAEMDIHSLPISEADFKHLLHRIPAGITNDQ